MTIIISNEWFYNEWFWYNGYIKKYQVFSNGYNAADTMEKLNNNKENELGENLLGKALEDIRSEYVL